MRRYLLYILASLFALASCSEPVFDYDGTDSIALSVDRIDVGGCGGTYTVNVDADYSCEVLSSHKWVTASLSADGRTISIKVDEYEVAEIGELRSAVVCVYNEENGMNRQILVKQHSKLYIDKSLGSKMKLRMIYVAGGTFQMGSNDDKAYESEKPIHAVTLDPYYILEHEVTQAMWAKVMDESVDNRLYKYYDDDYYNIRSIGDDYPMIAVSWSEAKKFCEKLSELTGKRFALPTEAQWEYAARGGNVGNGHQYSGSNTIRDVAWYEGNSNEYAHRIKKKDPNELGLYDMSGNVWEWCSDWYGTYSATEQYNPEGPSSGVIRVLRGGSWNSRNVDCRVSVRNGISQSDIILDVGFRVVCIP